MPSTTWKKPNGLHYYKMTALWWRLLCWTWTVQNQQKEKAERQNGTHGTRHFTTFNLLSFCFHCLYNTFNRRICNRWFPLFLQIHIYHEPGNSRGCSSFTSVCNCLCLQWLRVNYCWSSSDIICVHDIRYLPWLLQQGYSDPYQDHALSEWYSLLI